MLPATEARIRELGAQLIAPSFFLIRDGKPVRWSVQSFMPPDFATGDEEARFDPYTGTVEVRP